MIAKIVIFLYGSMYRPPIARTARDHMDGKLTSISFRVTAKSEFTNEKIIAIMTANGLAEVQNKHSD